jgi:hypothetical protein
MIIFMLILAALFMYYFSRKLKRNDLSEKKKGLEYYFYKNAFMFLLVFVVVGIIYLISFYLIKFVIGIDTVGLGNLILFEKKLEEVKSFVSVVELNAFQVFVLLFIIFVLSLFPAIKWRVKFISDLFEKYQKITKILYLIILVICSFTFFGKSVGLPDRDLILRIKTIRVGYANMRQDIQNALINEVYSGVYKKTVNEFPKEYSSVIKNYGLFNSEKRLLVETIKKYDGYVDISKDLDEYLRNYKFEKGKIFRVEKEDFTYDIHDSKKNEVVNESEVSENDIKNAVKKLEKYNKNITFLSLDAGEKVVCQLPKMFTEKIKTVLFEGIITEYPFLAPIINVFHDTVDDNLDRDIKEKAEYLVSMVNNKNYNFDKEFQAISNEIIKNIEIKKNDSAFKKSFELAKIEEVMHAKIKNIRGNIYNEISPKKIESVINSNLSMDIKWERVPDVSSYKIYSVRNGRNILESIRSAEETNITVWPENYPATYFIKAVINDFESKPMIIKESLMDSKSGARCQICGAKSIGYCHMREIYVCEKHNNFITKEGQSWICP